MEDRSCPICGAKTIATARIFGQAVTLKIMCKCEETALKKEKEKEAVEQQRDKIIQLRRNGIAEDMCNDWTFENDKGYNPEAMKKAKNYVENWAMIQKHNIGLLIFGNVGSGKSYMAYAIANKLIDLGFSAVVTTIPKLIAKLQSSFDGHLEIINEIERASLLVIDDLGVERDTDYVTEKAFEIINARIKCGKPLIVTTNLSPTDFKTENTRLKRIYDRILGATTPLHVNRASVRKEEGRVKQKIAAQILGI